MKLPLIGLVNHGCAKNLVDSELMLGILSQGGYPITLDADSADIVVINTCSFIHDAEKESVRSILEMADAGKKIIITGCLPQKHKKELHDAIPEAVAFLGTSDISKITQVVEQLSSNKLIYEVSESPKYIYPEGFERQQITVGASSYIKIAEGCDCGCGFCIIPSLRGAYTSRPIENIVKEAQLLAKKGVTEVVLIAQDTTAYGKDLYGKPCLDTLLQKINDIDGIEWIRVMYTYPSLFNDKLIKAYSSLEKVVKYVDIPLQHSHPDMLTRMLRPAFNYEDLINKIRDNIEGVAIRTAFIVGYPAETEEEFHHLYNFVEKMRFDKMGVFEYSREKGTPAYSIKPQILGKIKKQRKKELMLLQQSISKQINESFVGKNLPVIIESVDSKGIVTARTYRDAPEIDGVMYIETEKHVLPGDIEIATVNNFDAYDLFGTI